MTLDEALRRKLRGLADREERERETLSADARARIAASVAREAAAIARRRRMALVGGGAAAAVLAIAASVLLVVRPSERVTEPDRTAVIVPSHEPPPACASAPSSAMPRTTLAPGAPSELDRRARVVAHAQTLASFEAPSACRAEVLLVSGVVDVWARDLRGGELVVRTGGVSVLVHGTIFRVVRNLDEAIVSVDEGRVEVRAPGMEPAFVGAGESLRVRLDRTRADTVWVGAREPLAGSERASLHAITQEPRVTADVGTETAARRDAAQAQGVSARDVSRREVIQTPGVSARGVSPRESDESPASSTETAPRPEPEEVSIGALLREAERAYRDGRTDEARRLFRTAGSMRGPDAEAAWLRLGRLELRAGHADEAVAALAEHRRRFPNGRLSAEALFLEASAERERGHESEARALETRLLREHPDSPQARRVQDASAH